MVRQVARVTAIGWACGWSAAPVVSDDGGLAATRKPGPCAGSLRPPGTSRWASWPVPSSRSGCRALGRAPPPCGPGSGRWCWHWTRVPAGRAFSHALDPLWTIAAEPPDLGYAARIADSRLAVVAATVAGHRAYLRGRGHLTTIEW